MTRYWFHVHLISCPTCICMPHYFHIIAFLNNRSFSRDFFKYLRIRKTIFIWSSLRLCMNWITRLIPYEMFGRVWERKINFPTKCWHLPLSHGIWSEDITKWWFASIGVSISLQSSISVSTRRSHVYFR